MQTDFPEPVVPAISKWGIDTKSPTTGDPDILYPNAIGKLISMDTVFGKDVLTKKIDDLHKVAKALLLYETLSGDEIKELILKNKQPDRSRDFDSEDKEKISALGSLGLKPKPVH